MNIMTTIIEFVTQYIPDFGQYTIEYFVLFGLGILGLIKLFKG
jgi:hypothetical protein